MIALNQIRLLSQRHRVDMVAFKGRRNTNLGDLPDRCTHIELVDRPPRWRMVLNLVTGALGREPFGVSIWRGSAMTSAVDRHLSERDYDVVIFQLQEMAQFRPQSFRGPSIWALEDPPMLKYERMLPIWPQYLKPLTLQWVARARWYQNKQAPRFDRVVFVNKDDAADYARLIPAAKIDWVPSGIDVSEFCPDPSVPRRDGMIVISGNMFHTPNVDAVEYFCSNIFPLVRKRAEHANLWLVGARPASAVKKWASDPQIKVTGFVPDIRPYLREALVSVCAIRLRIGTQTKVLEALACGTPVVTTSAGNHGIGGEPGEHLYVADDPHEFAERIVSLLQRKRWNDLSENGRRLVVQNFTWERSVAKLEKILEELVLARATRERGV